ncbi:MAG: nitroreductase family protein [Candidatus Aminicenantes bacterium]|nr:MAG: nitroreductase family protein [Candidatus Aminicenantes bacterium]
MKTTKRRQFLKTGFVGSAGFFCSPFAAVTEDSQSQTDLFITFKTRRSVRKFKPTPVPDEHILQILEAAHYAPCPRNRQAWKFVVIKNRDILDQIRDECIKRGGEQSKQYFTDYMSAPVYVVVLADTQTRNPVNDATAGALAAENLMLAARALGYGSVFCVNSIPEDVTNKILNIPDNYKRVCITPIGIPDKWPETPPKKDLKEAIVYDRF